MRAQPLRLPAALLAAALLLEAGPAAAGPRHAGEKRLAEQRWFVKLADKDADGTLSQPELADGLDALDLDRDGAVSADEAKRARVTQDPILSRRLDTNGNGLVDDDEWRRLAHELDLDRDGAVDEREARHLHALRVLLVNPWIVARYDVDRNSRLDSSEEATAVTSADVDRDGRLDLLEAGALALRASGLWSRFDTDRSGALDAAETSAMARWLESNREAIPSPGWPASAVPRHGAGFMEKYGY